MVAVMLRAVPVFAQVDLTGTWVRSGQNDNGYAREQVDLLGIPMSADGRAKALSHVIRAALGHRSCQCQICPAVPAR